MRLVRIGISLWACASAAACGEVAPLEPDASMPAPNDPDAGAPMQPMPDAAPACMGPNGACLVVSPGPDAQSIAQTALIEAEPGDVILFRSGVYEFSRELSLTVDGVTVRGEGMDKTVLSFANQTEGAQGFLATGNDVVFEDLAIEDPVGDGLKVEGSTGVIIRRVRVEWTAGPKTENGAYALYPVLCKNVLVEDSVVIGSSDAGVYIGQSDNVILRRNRAEFNVIGLEVENSTNVDVYDNTATNNTGGMLITNLPGLEKQNASKTRVFNNDIYSNNTNNFGEAGNIVSLIPRGSGIIMLAAHQIEIFENLIKDHDTGNMAILSYLATGVQYDDDVYDPYSDTIYVYNNEFMGGGAKPDAPPGSMGALMVDSLATIMGDEVVVPDITFFGFVDPNKASTTDPRQFLPEYNLCFRDNGDADFANLDVNFMAYDGIQTVTTDINRHDCMHASLEPVELP